ncbi:mCG145866, partial [Mus musculus]
TKTLHLSSPGLWLLLRRVQWAYRSGRDHQHLYRVREHLLYVTCYKMQTNRSKREQHPEVRLGAWGSAFICRMICAACCLLLGLHPVIPIYKGYHSLWEYDKSSSSFPNTSCLVELKATLSKVACGKR